MADVLKKAVAKAATENASMVDPKKADEKPAGMSRAALLTLLGAAGADMGSTAYFQQHPEMGMHEANPLIKGLPTGAQLPAGAAMEFGGLLLGKKLLKNHPKILNGLMYGMAGAHGAAALSNLRGMQRKPSASGPSSRQSNEPPFPGAVQLPGGGWVNPDYVQ